MKNPDKDFVQVGRSSVHDVFGPDVDPDKLDDDQLTELIRLYGSTAIQIVSEDGKKGMAYVEPRRFEAYCDKNGVVNGESRDTQGLAKLLAPLAVETNDVKAQILGKRTMIHHPFGTN